MYTISETAKLLNIDKKTLMRWDQSKKFPAQRDSNNFRMYDEKVVNEHVLWFALRRKHRAHLTKFKPIRKEMDRFIRSTPLNDMSPTPIFNIEEMGKAYDAKEVWDQEEKRIKEEYAHTPHGVVSPES